MTDDVRYRWIDQFDATAEDKTRLEQILATRGWASLNWEMPTRVRLAERAGKLSGFYVFQFFPHAEPMWVSPSERGSGVAEQLAQDMLDFLTEVRARGWMIIAESKHAQVLCEKFGMTRVPVPVYVMVGPGGVGG